MKENLELRMYGLVPYNISPIQAGIQFGHGVIEYSLMKDKDKRYLEWATKWKTFIILNGGTSNSGLETYYGMEKSLGTMEQHYQTLVNTRVICSKFHEPDLNYMLSSINFIVDERVFNYDKWEVVETARMYLNNELIVFRERKDAEDDYVKEIGKDWMKVVFLRNFLKGFRLA